MATISEYKDAIVNAINECKSKTKVFDIYCGRTKGKEHYYVEVNDKAVLINGMGVEKGDCLNALTRAVMQCGVGKTATFIDAYHNGRYIKIPRTLRGIDACESFFKVNEFLNAHKCIGLSASDVYIMPQFGKRGIYEDQPQRQTFFSESEDSCADLLKWLVANECEKFTILLKTFVDHEDESASRYYETECYGSRGQYAVIETSNGTTRIVR